MGVDFGKKRIGIAISESWELASPHSIVKHPGSDEAALERVARLGSELDAEMYVMGVPGGNRHDAARIQARFQQLALLLHEKSQREVVLWDETLTTVEALEMRRSRGVRG